MKPLSYLVLWSELFMSTTSPNSSTPQPSAKFTFSTPKQLHNGVSRWGHWEVFKLLGLEVSWMQLVLINWPPERLLAPSTLWGHSKKTMAMNQKDDPHWRTWPCWLLDLGHPATRTIRHIFLLFLSYPEWYFAIAA